MVNIQHFLLLTDQTHVSEMIFVKVIIDLLKKANIKILFKILLVVIVCRISFTVKKRHSVKVIVLEET